MKLETGKQITIKYILHNILRNKDNQAIRFG